MNWPHLWSNILQWVTLHPTMAYLGIFAVALSESLALVGLLVPGTVMMIGIGALVGSGVLSLKITFPVAMAGAVVGDGVSYWLGRHYHHGLKKLWPFCKFPQMLIRGEEFFQRHGGKSVLLGRFVGPVRPVIPMIAGMLDMPAGRFLLVNILSAVGWAFAYLLPGIVLGSSLTILGAVSTRLSLLFLLVALLLWLAFWLGRKAFSWLGRLGPKGERLLLPLLCLTLFLAGWLFLGVLEDLVNLDPLVRADQSIYSLLRSLRTPWGDRFLVAVTEFGDGLVNVSIAATVLLVLLLRRKRRAAGFWLLAFAGGMGFVELFKWGLHRSRPIAIYQGISSWAFPSGHTTMSVVLYGFLAILLVRSLTSRWRWLPFSMAIGVSLLIAFSRIYLGAHWLSDVLGGLALGWAWTTFVGIFYLRRSTSEVPRNLLLLVVFSTLLLSGSWRIYSRHALDISRYQVRESVENLSIERWRSGGWQGVPGWRIDLSGEAEEPLTFQWAGDPDRLAVQLTKEGWKHAESSGFKSLLSFFVPKVTILQLPLLPHLENGRQERLLLSLNQGTSRLVLRLWPTKFKLTEAGTFLWVGTVTSERAFRVAGLLSLPKEVGNLSEAQQILAQTISPMSKETWGQRSTKTASKSNSWDGRVLLAEDIRLIHPGGAK